MHIYCGGRLFSAWDRLALALMEREVAKVLARTQHIRPDQRLTFLPFRDSNESLPVGPERSKAIYNLDIAALESSYGLLTRLNTLGPDSGVLFEIGFAVARGIPSACLLSDFVHEETSQSEVGLLPALRALGVLVVDMGRSEDDASLPFLRRQLRRDRKSTREFVSVALQWIANPEKVPFAEPASESRVFVDICGGRYQWAREMAGTFCESVSSLGVPTVATFRDAGDEQFMPQWKRDIELAKSCPLACFALESFEMHPTTALLMGIRAAKRLPSILLHTAVSEMNGPFGQVMRCNLMIEHGVVRHAQSLRDAVQIVKEAYE